MPSFSDIFIASAPPEEVWKILYDPAQFPAWWAGLVSVDAGSPDDSGETDLTVYYADQPEVPLHQRLQTVRSGHRILISCLVTDLHFTWQLDPLDGGAATQITAVVDIPDRLAHLLDGQRAATARSLRQLAALAAPSP
jgi:uncharacterized protein YndB with AHSA1/START domain